MPRIRIGVVGCGLIAQMMHLPHLVELDELYELGAVCDVSPGALAFVGDRYGVARRHRDWRDLLQEPLDAVLIATPGSHAPVALAALRAGKHVLTEKPMCYTLREADELVCLRVPARFEAVGLEYASFAPPSDAEVRSLLLSSRAP